LLNSGQAFLELTVDNNCYVGGIMKRYRVLQVVVTGLLIFGMFQVVYGAQRVSIKPRNVVINYQQRELKASPTIKAKLAALRQKIKTKNLTYQVGYTTALDHPLAKITGLKAPKPAQLTKMIKLQNARAAQVLRTLPPLKVLACNAWFPRFDWRKARGTTGVRNQRRCGSCWAFATHGAFEGNYRLRKNVVINSSEQDSLDCSGLGTCDGGWWTNQYLVDRGCATESIYPYTVRQGNCKNVSRPYKAITWGFVGTSRSTPSVSAIKHALCQHGPLTVAVRATDDFHAYTGGVFNEFESGDINHGVTLIGWDDSKGSWLIKNSWGTGWGSTCGYGTEKGYMWIRYECNRIGFAASWIEAE
jgi:C1A family cysteine protease